ncbi:MAG: hypothetical protein COB76_02785, partial [Alphaproteobacteria bacterium]
EDVLNRYLDVPFILDSLENGDIECPTSMDLSCLGMSGHSFGAMTTQIMSGQRTGNPDLLDLTEERFIAGIAYSPVPNSRLKNPASEIYGDMTLPLLHLTGSEDHSPLDGPIQHLRDEIFEYAGSTNNAMQMSVILEGADHMVFNGSRGQLSDYDGMDNHKDQIKILALSWWDYFLKRDANSGHWIRQNLQGYLGTSSCVNIKNDTGSMI